MDELAIDLFAQNRDQSLIVGRTSQTDSSDYEENSYGFPYGNIISNLLNIAQVPSVGCMFLIYFNNIKFISLY